MDKQEKRFERRETKHSMKRRSPWHDYHKKGTYMLTLVVEGRAPLLGKLKGNADASGDSPDRPMVELSELGKCIMREEIRKIHQHYPKLEVWKTCIMPDHIHMIVRVNEDMSEGRHLGHVMAGFKFGCNIAYWKYSTLAKSRGKGYLRLDIMIRFFFAMSSLTIGKNTLMTILEG